MPADLYFDELAHTWEEEGLFARDIDGRLIRVVSKTEEDYTRFVTVVIDGQEVRVPRAVPTTDAQGNILYADAAGRTMPRATTIYDAARTLIDRRNAELRRKDPRAPLLENPIPTLCHMDHLRPVGVCRVCSVAAETFEIDRRDPTKKTPRRQEKLVPACMQPVEDNMVVYTMNSPDQRQSRKVEASVRVLLELLSADHAPPHDGQRLPHELTDLERLLARYGSRLGIDSRRYAPRQPLDYARDESSPLILVDPNSCILCDRCSRSCADVKENFIIGRTGKGYTARIGFDLDQPMGQSDCVECGECMLACPTTALTFRQPLQSDWFKEQLASGSGKTAVTPEEMEDNELLRTLPWRYRQWNQSSLVRWKVKQGTELCRLGDYGSTAFILNDGQFGVWVPQRGEGGKLKDGWDRGEPTFVNTKEDLILGEMTILSSYPRAATVRALADGEVFEIRRNILFTLQRSPEAREKLDRVYRSRAISNHLRRVPLFAGLSGDDRRACLEILTAEPRQESDPRQKPRRRSVELLRVEPGQTIFRQGERADCFYMIRIGHVKVTQIYGGQERVLDYLRPDRSFGEIACIGNWEEIRANIPADLLGPLDNRRTTSCTALDDVELVRIDAEVFRRMLNDVPAIKERVIAQAKDYLSRVSPTAPMAGRISSPVMREYADQGLYNAQRLLVLDLEACTRCDECTKACSDTHGGITRLIREGLRFGKWLVASSCRSCADPYCLVGCPVDAIHRIDPNSARRAIKIQPHGDDPDKQRMEIQIEDNCIGCGQCAENCPYGNINMHGREVQIPLPPGEGGPGTAAKRWSPGEGRLQAVVEFRATTCDLCGDIVGNDWRNVSCVHACPHEAAFRMKGEELLKIVGG